MAVAQAAPKGACASARGRAGGRSKGDLLPDGGRNAQRGGRRCVFEPLDGAPQHANAVHHEIERLCRWPAMHTVLSLADRNYFT